MNEKFRNKNDVVVIGTIEATNFKYDPTWSSYDKSFTGAYVKDDYKKQYMLRVLVEKKNENGDVLSTAHVNVDFAFGVFAQYKYNGEIKDNSTFGELKKIAESPNGGVGLPVRISGGNFVENKYADQNLQLQRKGNKFEGRYISLSNVNLEDAKAEGYVTGVIESIRDDFKDGSPSGDKIVDFLTVKYMKDGVPVADKLTFVVPENLADDFESLLREGDSARLDVEMIDIKTEAKVEEHKSRGFGDRSAETTVSGTNRLQYRVFAGDIIEEGVEGYVDEDAFELIKHSYEVSCEALIQKKREKENKNGGSSAPISSRTVDSSASGFFETAEDPFAVADTKLPMEDELPFA
jgi:hypothetical protein